MIFIDVTNQELQAIFERVLARIAANDISGCPSDTGLDTETEAALNDYAAGRRSAAEARAEFTRMIDGTHDRAARQRYAKLR